MSPSAYTFLLHVIPDVDVVVVRSESTVRTIEKLKAVFDSLQLILS